MKSPVTITGRIFAWRRVLITGPDSGFSRFSITSSPRNKRLCSTRSRDMRIIRKYDALIGRQANARTRKPSRVNSNKFEWKLEGTATETFIQQYSL